MAGRQAVLLICLATASVAVASFDNPRPNYWKACDPKLSATACRGVTLPQDIDQSTGVADVNDPFDIGTCCMEGRNPATSVYGFYCFQDNTGSNGMDCQPGLKLSKAETTGFTTVLSGDPEIAAFDGRKFTFEGVPGSFYNLLTEHDHQINGHFTPAFMFDHNGTYITTVGFKFKDVRVRIHVVKDGSFEVDVNDKPLTMVDPKSGQFRTEVTPASPSRPDDRIFINWQHYKPRYGHAVELTTPMVGLLIWSAPPGPDAGGKMQPAYINFQTSLLELPRGQMHGILGQSLARALAIADEANDKAMADAARGAPNWVGAEAEYKVSSLFADDFQYNRYGDDTAVASTARKLLALAAFTKQHVGLLPLSGEVASQHRF